MTVPNRLYNSTAAIKYVIDAEELNQNFDSLSTGTGIDNGAILPRHLSTAGATSAYYFSTAIKLGQTTGYLTPEEGMIFYRTDPTTGAGSFLGVSKDETGNLVYVVLG